jgi:hypothetical protein
VVGKDFTRKLVPIVDAAIPILLACSWAGLMLAFPYTVSMDSASHLYTSGVATDLLFRADSPFHKFYELNSAFLPDWGTTFLFSFVNLFVPGVGAERIVKMLLPLLFGAAVWSVLRLPSRYAIVLIPLFYPLIFSFFFSAGFYGFYIGTALMICALHFLLPHPAALSTRQALLLSVILLATYYFHIFPFALAMIFMVCSVALDSVLESYGAFAIAGSSGTLSRTRNALSNGLTCVFWKARGLWLAGLPALLVFAVEFQMRSGARSGLPNFRHLKTRIADTLAFEGPFNFVAWNPGVKVFTLVFVFVLFAYALAKKSSSPESVWRRQETKLIVFIACAMLLFVFTPDEAGGAAFIAARFLYTAFLLMVLFAALHLSRKEARLCCLLAVLPFAYSQQRAVYRDAQTLQPYAVEIQESAQHIKPHSALLTLAYNTTSRRFEAYVFEQAPLRHLDAYLAVKTQAVLLNNYEGMTDYFPLRLRPQVISPELITLQGEFLPNKLSALKSFLAQDHDLIDYLILWETDHGSVGEPEKKAIRQLISANFRLVYENQTPAPLYLYARPSLASRTTQN